MVCVKCILHLISKMRDHAGINFHEPWKAYNVFMLAISWYFYKIVLISIHPLLHRYQLIYISKSIHLCSLHYYQMITETEEESKNSVYFFYLNLQWCNTFTKWASEQCKLYFVPNTACYWNQYGLRRKKALRF